MPILILLPFGVFFVCCLLQFWFLKKVRDALIDRHPDTFLAVEKSSIFPMQGLWKFARGSSYKKLGDVELNRHVRNLKRLMIVGIAAWVAYGLSIFAIPLSAPSLPLKLADGSYQNDCCGSIILANGQMTLAGKQVSYVVESDKRGAYVLPPYYVGASATGFVIRPKGFPLKLYVNDETHPTELELMDDADSNVFTFHRLNAR